MLALGTARSSLNLPSARTGEARLPAFRADLVDMFGADRLEQRDAFTAVVHGLGVRAQQLWATSGAA
jgi:hypothetical protein